MSGENKMSGRLRGVECADMTWIMTLEFILHYLSFLRNSAIKCPIDKELLDLHMVSL